MQEIYSWVLVIDFQNVQIEKCLRYQLKLRGSLAQLVHTPHLVLFTHSIEYPKCLKSVLQFELQQKAETRLMHSSIQKFGNQIQKVTY